jgi:dipeptidase D
MEKPQNYPDNLKLWDLFFKFTQTPRPSKNETKAQELLISLAKENNLEFKQDQVGNIIIYVPGKGSRVNDEPVLIQNHIDMVTDAIKGKQIDFDHDPIEVFVEGGWLKARGTTLGADNGIGCAAALATIYENDLEHPPLELLFTIDEETGLNGALGLDTSIIKAKKMLNLDTEEWGSLYIGCAGGIDYELERDFDLIENEGLFHYELTLQGLCGGHSGVDIHEQRANAIKCLNDVLINLNEPLLISELVAGRAHNIIPREASVTFSSKKDLSNELNNTLDAIESRLRSYFSNDDKNFEFILSEAQKPNKTLSEVNSKILTQLINLFPHGAHSFDLASEEKLVSMSNNLAKFIFKEGKAYIQSSLRFFDREEVKKIESQIKDLGEIFGFTVKSDSEYPSWKPVRENALLDKGGECV